MALNCPSSQPEALTTNSANSPTRVTDKPSPLTTIRPDGVLSLLDSALLSIALEVEDEDAFADVLRALDVDVVVLVIVEDFVAVDSV